MNWYNIKHALTHTQNELSILALLVDDLSCHRCSPSAIFLTQAGCSYRGGKPALHLGNLHWPATSHRREARDTDLVSLKVRSDEPSLQCQTLCKFPALVCVSASVKINVALAGSAVIRAYGKRAGPWRVIPQRRPGTSKDGFIICPSERGPTGIHQGVNSD